MIRKLQLCKRVAKSMLVALIFTTIPATVAAIEATHNQPANAHTKRFSDDWECDRSYIKDNLHCTAITIPVNGYLDYTGHSWKCYRGYKDAKGQCAKVVIPQNAYLEVSGETWACHRPYRKQSSKCSLE